MIFAVVALAAAYSLQEGVTPVQKVVQLLQDMLAKGKQEKHDETVHFSTYRQFCQSTNDEKQRSIADANAAIERLSADIQKATSDADVLGRQIAELEANIGAWEQDKAAALATRAEERATYVSTHTDYSESVDALDRAVTILSRQSHDRKQAESLLQQVAFMDRVPRSAKRMIASFLATDAEIAQDPLSVSAPQSNAYEFQSGGVVEMLEKLKDKFQDERNDLEKAEMKSKHAFDMLVNDLVNQISEASKQSGEKAKEKSGRQADAASDKGDLADTTTNRDEDQKYLDSLVAQCDQKSREFEQRQQLRADEITAISKAIEIIQSPSVAGHADTHLPALVQTGHSFGLRKSSVVRPVQRNVAAFLSDAAARLNSRVLSLIAVKVRNDGFDKVKKLIKDLIVRLMEEATEESEHKGWCDTEMGTNKQTREQKAEAVDMLAATKDQLTADIAKLASEIAALSDAIAESDAAVAKATGLRAEEKAKNAATVADAKEAQTAVASALQVLNEFYASAAEATALVQQTPDEDAPLSWDSAYKGQGSASTGVIGMLEVIQSDFARLEADTSAGESENAEQHQRFLDESDKDKAVKSTELDHRERTRTEKHSDLNDCEKDLSATQQELDAALAYYDKLKPSCVDAGLSYEERVRRREEEIQSLKEALRILEGEDIA